MALVRQVPSKQKEKGQWQKKEKQMLLSNIYGAHQR